jgi:quercetin dioxygenase-like cupin family protein
MLEVWLDEVEYHHLERGDSFWFESNRGHGCSTPPTYRQLFSG